MSWLQDNLEDYIKQDQCSEITSKDEELVDFERLWIYSHHIKSKTKRKNIIQNANELDLSGFMRPGKPGVICVEGLKSNTTEFYKIIKSWTWQKITIRSNEVKNK
uniref:Small nuclear ribonucleoprotein Prp3 C-terminal domain-containing protein n=1 Tax=Megaselia scalaris TaxID=36166 RepID=T1H496_MEGSC